jgi:hypothetical protein
MSTIQHHPHAAFDRFPQLVRELTEEFGVEGIAAVIERFIEAERADFYWGGRIAERPIGPYEAVDEEDGAQQTVAILGFFRGRYYIATCLVDDARRVCWMPRVRHFEGLASAEMAFAAGT